MRLSEFSSGAGCGCKLAPSILAEALVGSAVEHPSLMVGADTGDDAAVWRLGDRALVLTTDFFTPVVDDARTWGRIAATNAVSDVYAMGARPLLALNLLAWNSTELDVTTLREVLAGGAEIAEEAGFVIAGGHSIEDAEPKYGLAVLGEVDPDRVLTNGGFRVGDRLVLTKPLGVGLVTTALKRGDVGADQVDAAVALMTTLNADASRAAVSADATGATDVTGFGLLGHLTRAMVASGTSAVVDVESVPLLDGARDLAARGASPGGTARNLAWCGELVTGGDELDRQLLADPQTSGGLLIGLAADRVDGVLDQLRGSGHAAAEIGLVETGPAGQVSLR